jgi:radical SAM-linked protein
MTRLRFRYTKLGKIRFIGHRDLARCWERALRRSGLPVASSEGFSPRPKVHFALALPTGFESVAEYIDVDLISGHDPLPASVELAGRFSTLLPVGVEVDAVAEVESGPSLQAAVVACRWQVEVAGMDAGALGAAMDRFLAADEVRLVRKRRDNVVEHDVRPAVESLTFAGDGITPQAGGVMLVADLLTHPLSLRPTELVGSILGGQSPTDIAHLDVRACRTHQWIESGGARQEPLSPATDAPHAARRAS